jgi:two-component system response regulator YesN
LDSPGWQNTAQLEMEHAQEQWVEAVIEQDKIRADMAVRNIQKKAEQLRMDPEKFISQSVHSVRQISKEIHGSAAEEVCFFLNITQKQTETLNLLLQFNRYFFTLNLDEDEEDTKDPKLVTIDQYIMDHIYENITSIDIAPSAFKPQLFFKIFQKNDSHEFHRICTSI